MRHRLILLAVGLSVAGVLAVGSSTQARAGGNGATVVRDNGQCFVSGDAGSWLFSCTIQFVVQPDGGIVLTNASFPWLSYHELSNTRPDLIHLQITGQPDGGPAVDYTVNAASGIANATVYFVAKQNPATSPIGTSSR